MIPTVYQEFLDCWRDASLRQSRLDAYQRGEISFVPDLLPEQALRFSGEESLAIVRARVGTEAFEAALDPANTDPDRLPERRPAAIQSPVAAEPDGEWIKRCNMVGINVRTVQNFWNLVKYALTLPQAQNAIQLLPFFEAGVVGSLYGMSSWELNAEFYSDELAALCPHLQTKETQLRAVINLLHALGKAVGMDVVPHTDRYAQIVLAYPEYFEWLQRQDTEIISHADTLHEHVQQKIIEFVQARGAAVAGEPAPSKPSDLFSSDVDEARRLRILFGKPEEYERRQERRNQLIHHLFSYGYEPMPGTMAPPFRGMTPDLREGAKNVDANGMVWRDYVITKPQGMSRVFGPLARFKYYHPRNQNRDWELDFHAPNVPAWEYVCEHYAQVRRRYGFDFMRGDMAHVQMRPEGIPRALDRYYDILGAIKAHVRRVNHAPYFGYFAETFLAARDIFGYGEELDHLEAADADATLGDLQSVCVGTPVFLQRFRQYADWAETRLCAPSFTLMTGDKDDPRFDEFYRSGSEARLFIGLFLTDMPSYMGLGFETRDIHYAPAPNEHYTKLFVFHETSGAKATHGPYIWGKNGVLYHRLNRVKQFADAIWPKIKQARTRWLIAPDATGANPIVAWTQRDAPQFVFVVNTNTQQAQGRFGIPLIPNAAPETMLKFEFSTAELITERDAALHSNGKHYQLFEIAPGEGRVYRISPQAE